MYLVGKPPIFLNIFLNDVLFLVQLFNPISNMFGLDYFWWNMKLYHFLQHSSVNSICTDISVGRPTQLSPSVQILILIVSLLLFVVLDTTKDYSLLSLLLPLLIILQQLFNTVLPLSVEYSMVGVVNVCVWERERVSEKRERSKREWQSAAVYGVYIIDNPSSLFYVFIFSLLH